MAIRSFRPTTKSRRHTQLEDRTTLYGGGPIKGLSVGKRGRAGRNNEGRITVRHRGGGVKRMVRIVDHKKDKVNVPAVVERLEYDPNMSGHLALLKYADGERRYVLAARGLEKGSAVISGEGVPPTVGNTTVLRRIPSGTPVFDVELTKGRGGQLGRSAGVSLYVQGVDPSGKYMQVKMPSGEIRLVWAECFATVGQVGNEDHSNVKLGKAGRKRRMGIRPTVRGMAMYSEQHPHGGGEGRGTIGRAKDIWGHRIGTKTRRNQRTRKFIIKLKTTRRVPYSKI
jgi:large subunit ribosomal protein L2